MKDFLNKINFHTFFIAILTFTIGWQLGHKDIAVKWQTYAPTLKVINKEPPQNIDVDFKLFWDTWDLVSRQYLDKKAIDTDKLYYGAISGMVSAVGDPYTVFLPPEAQKSTQDELNGSFEGVGIQLGFNSDSRLVVVTPLDGTPAQKKGILPGDMIVKIDEKETLNISIPEAVKLIRGPKGTDVALTVLREGETTTREFKLTRDMIIVKSVEESFKTTKSGKKVAYVKLTRFGERTEDEWDSAVSNILSSGSSGIILDMRNNPGGLLGGAVFIASEFLPDGDVVLQENSQGQRFKFKVDRAGKLLNLPLVVLINKGSASASEIVAGALQDRGRAKLVGEKTFGKGTIQEAETLPGGTGLHITVAKWLTPNGKWVNETKGLEPNVVIEMPKAEEDEIIIQGGEKDSQFIKALELLE